MWYFINVNWNINSYREISVVRAFDLHVFVSQKRNEKLSRQSASQCQAIVRFSLDSWMNDTCWKKLQYKHTMCFLVRMAEWRTDTNGVRMRCFYARIYATMPRKILCPRVLTNSCLWSINILEFKHAMAIKWREQICLMKGHQSLENYNRKIPLRRWKTSIQGKKSRRSFSRIPWSLP